MNGLQLIATGGALPGRTITNDALSRMVDTSDAWITSRTGIRTRHWCTEDESAATLAIAAARQALDRSGLAPADIACCVCATLSAPDATPSVACQVQRALGLPEDRPALDVNAACSGFLYGTAVARGLLATLGGQYALVIGCEALSRLMDPADRSTCVLFGDGAGAAIFFNLKKNPDIQISFRGFRPSAKAIGRSYTVGLPSIAMQCVGSVMTFFMNQILMAFSATAVAVFGVYFKLQSFVFMPIFGMNNGMVPIISYNYGARKPERVKKTIRLSVFYAECIMLVGFCIFQFLPDKLLSLFAASDAMLAIGVPALRIICPHFLLAGAGIVLSSVFQALGNGVFSLTVSICRQLVVLIPAAWLLSRTGEVNMVWWAFIIAEVVSLALSLVFMARINRTVIVPLSEKQDAAV